LKWRPAAILNFQSQILQTFTSDRRLIASLWLTSTIFNFKVLKFLTTDGVMRAVLNQHTKFTVIGQTVDDISRFFFDFEGGGRRHLGFSKNRNFNGRSAVGSRCALRQISSKSVERLRRCDVISRRYEHTMDV